MNPNILFIMTDEQRFDCLGSVNHVVKTPHLDALAREAVTFTRAYTTNPSCVPARAAMITGRYPSKCGVPTYITYLPPSETTFTSLLQKHGYYTAVVGKQHFGDTSIDQGYDYADINDLHGPVGWNVNKDAYPSYMKYLTESCFTHSAQLSEPVNRFSRRWKADVMYHIDDYIGELAKAWLKEGRPKDQPWYCCVSFPGPHMPFDGSGLPQEEQYRLQDIDLPKTSEKDLDAKPPHFKEQLRTGQGNPGGGHANGMTEEELRQTRMSYYANMTLIDKKIGEIVSLLKETGEYDNTLILFTSDHGDYMGDFGMMGKGQYLSEVLMRVPLIVKPAVSGFRGRAEDAMVFNIDVAATCLSAAGAPIPENMDSQDVSPFWHCPDETKRRGALYMEAAGLRAVRTEQWKLVHYHGRVYGEMYDLVNDPWEINNLWGNPYYADIKQQLSSVLIDQFIALGKRSHVAWNDDAPSI
jgi:arylsulfatase